MITSPDTQAVYAALADHGPATLGDLALRVGEKEARVLGHLRRLWTLGLVDLAGSKRGGIWAVREDRR